MKQDKEKLANILNEVNKQAKIVFGDKLNSVILYGSYARGDFNEESDIDIMICADIEPSEVTSFLYKFIDKLYIFELDNDCVISPCIIPISTFNKYKTILPFYKNVLKEGIKVGI